MWSQECLSGFQFHCPLYYLLSAQSLEYHPVQLTMDQSKNLKKLAS